MDEKETGLDDTRSEGYRPWHDGDGVEAASHDAQDALLAADGDDQSRDSRSKPKEWLSSLASKLHLGHQEQNSPSSSSSIPRPQTRRHHSHRLRDLWHVHSEALADLSDSTLYPELDWDAHLRRENTLSKAESDFLLNRKERIAQSEAFRQLAGVKEGEVVQPEDVPTVSLGGSGGGYRAMLGFLGFIEEFQREETAIWPLVSYSSGVSGSCWTLGTLYTVGRMDAAYLFDHFALTSSRHPLSLAAIDAVARSAKGTYFQLGPLLQKLHLKHLHPGPLDLYGTLLTSHLFLSPLKSRDEGQEEEEPCLKREWYQWSRVFERCRIDQGEQPLPILTAVRHERPWKDWKAPGEQPFASSNHMSAEHQAAGSRTWWQWFELSPLEFGSDELEGWIPAWSFGRRFDGGKSTQRLPERSFSLLLGMCTSAPAGPLSAWLQTLYRNLPTGKFGNWLRKETDEWTAEHPEQTEKIQAHHPVHAMNEANPFFGAEKKDGRGEGFENSPRIHLIDAGISNNLPQVHFRPGREVDVVVMCDYSSDVQSGGAVQRLVEYGKERGYVVKKASADGERATKDGTGGDAASSEKHDAKGDVHTPAAEEIAQRFAGHYAQTLTLHPTHNGSDAAEASVVYNSRHQPQLLHEQTMVYLPLLPHAVQPGYDPSTAPFSSSYNLTWTDEQVQTIRKTARACAREGAVAVRNAIRAAYEKRKSKRLDAEARM